MKSSRPAGEILVRRPTLIARSSPFCRSSYTNVLPHCNVRQTSPTERSRVGSGNGYRAWPVSRERVGTAAWFISPSMQAEAASSSRTPRVRAGGPAPLSRRRSPYVRARSRGRGAGGLEVWRAGLVGTTPGRPSAPDARHAAGVSGSGGNRLDCMTNQPSAPAAPPDVPVHPIAPHDPACRLTRSPIAVPRPRCDSRSLQQCVPDPFSQSVSTRYQPRSALRVRSE